MAESYSQLLFLPLVSVVLQRATGATYRHRRWNASSLEGTSRPRWCYLLEKEVIMMIILYCIDPFLYRFSRHEPCRSAPDHSIWHCAGVYTPKHYRQLQVKDLPKVPTWRLERDTNPWLSGRKASTLPMRHHAQKYSSSTPSIIK